MTPPAPLQFQARTWVPESTFAADIPLVAVMRGDHVGSLHRGSFAVATPDGELVAQGGDATERVFLRSAAKPFQAMPAVLAGALEKFSLDEPEVAVLCASHHGEPRHRAAVRAVLRRAGIGEEALHCGIHSPIDAASSADLVRQGQEPTELCNNCSGAHAGMLLACVARGWPLANYELPEHPLQVETRSILARFAGVRTEEVQTATDNCAVPTFRLPLVAAATAFARFATCRKVPEDLAAAAQRLRSAMMHQPGMVGGRESFDSDLMAATRGRLVCKGGAEAFQGIGLPERALGIALKISDGGARAVPPATMRILRDLALLDPEMEIDLAEYAEPQVPSARGAAVGRLTPVFELEAT